MLCPHCSAQLPDDAHFCGECGADVTLAPPAAPVQHTSLSRRTNTARVSELAEKERNTKIGIAVVVSLAAIAVACAIIAFTLLL